MVGGPGDCVSARSPNHPAGLNSSDCICKIYSFSGTLEKHAQVAEYEGRHLCLSSNDNFFRAQFENVIHRHLGGRSRHAYFADQRCDSTSSCFAAPHSIRAHEPCAVCVRGHPKHERFEIQTVESSAITFTTHQHLSFHEHMF